MNKKILSFMLMLSIMAGVMGCGSKETQEEVVSDEVVVEEALSGKETEAKETKETKITEEDHGDYVEFVPADRSTCDEIGEIPDEELDHSVYQDDVEFTKKVNLYASNGALFGYIKKNGKAGITFKKGDWYGITIDDFVMYAKVSDVDGAVVAKVEETEDTAETTRSASATASSAGSSSSSGTNGGSSSAAGSADASVAQAVPTPVVEETVPAPVTTNAISAAEAQALVEQACRAHGLVTYVEYVDQMIAIGELDASERDLALSWRYEASWFQTKIAADGHFTDYFPYEFEGHGGYDIVFDREEAGYYIFTCYTY